MRQLWMCWDSLGVYHPDATKTQRTLVDTMIEYIYIYICVCVATWKLQHQTTVSCSSTPHFSIGAFFWDGRISPAIGSKR